MAEIIGVAASVVQLLGCIQQLRAFCKAVRGIPQELQATLDEIEYLRQVISTIATNDRNVPATLRDNGLQACLEHCRVAAANLEAVTRRTVDLLRKKGILRPGSLVKAVLKKEEIKELKEKLESTKNALNLAVTIHSHM
jgi:chaperonin cofactor prefoldin